MSKDLMADLERSLVPFAICTEDDQGGKCVDDDQCLECPLPWEVHTRLRNLTPDERAEWVRDGRVGES